jgi:hypothetical protein
VGGGVMLENRKYLIIDGDDLIETDDIDIVLLKFERGCRVFKPVFFKRIALHAVEYEGE